MQEELVDAAVLPELTATEDMSQNLDVLISDQQSLLIIDDDQEIREYISQVFKSQYQVYTADNAEDGFILIKAKMPDLVISDVVMNGQTGIDLCNRLKDDVSLSHIPVILLTGSTSTEAKLKGLQEGAADYISKPFDKDVLLARVTNLLKSRHNLQRYFYNEITLKNNNLKISEEYKIFLDKCIRIVESNLSNADFTIKTLA
ncbi:MAG: response regulator, partial [Pedobacter sp.]